MGSESDQTATSSIPIVPSNIMALAKEAAKAGKADSAGVAAKKEL
jgi:hypothetical protein